MARNTRSHAIDEAHVAIITANAKLKQLALALTGKPLHEEDQDCLFDLSCDLDKLAAQTRTLRDAIDTALSPR